MGLTGERESPFFNVKLKFHLSPLEQFSPEAIRWGRARSVSAVEGGLLAVECHSLGVTRASMLGGISDQVG